MSEPGPEAAWEQVTSPRSSLIQSPNRNEAPAISRHSIYFPSFGLVMLWTFISVHVTFFFSSLRQGLALSPSSFARAQELCWRQILLLLISHSTVPPLHVPGQDLAPLVCSPGPPPLATSQDFTLGLPDQPERTAFLRGCICFAPMINIIIHENESFPALGPNYFSRNQ